MFLDTFNNYKPVLADLLLITLGSFIFALGIEAIVIHHQFITGGLYGTALLLFYKTNMFTAGIWFLLLNIPLFVAGWLALSKRYFFYSLYGVIIITLFTETIKVDFAIHNQLYAAVAGGAFCGVGAGIILRSRGSGGGLDTIAIIMNKKFNLGVGKFFMMYNIFLYLIVMSQYGSDLVIASIILTFVSSLALEQVLTLFNQRKIVYILSSCHQEIVTAIQDKLQLGATLLEARGAYSGKSKQMIMTITNNLQVKRLEDRVFEIDNEALFIVENSFNVIGSSFGKRKMY